MFKLLWPRLKAHFFLSSPGGAVGGWRGCHNADGLYFDYEALVVMGDRRRGVATLCMCLYKPGTQTPTSLVIPWPKLIMTMTDDGRCCSQLLLLVICTGVLQQIHFFFTSLTFWIYSCFVTCFWPLFSHCQRFALCSFSITRGRLSQL